jgi:hypothetical protein
VKKCILCLILFLALPAFAAISPIQSAAKWTCSGSGQSVTCVIATTAVVSSGHLLAVWTFWESSNGSGGTYPYTAGVDDSGTGGGANTWYSAVGPTLQLAASTPTTAQLFYAKNINPSTGGDPIRVTYSCPYSPGPPPTGNPTCTTSPSITLAGVVVAEFSGADTMYPLDSVSAGYSTSGNPTYLLDSGNTAPANSNLMVFGGGITDSGTLLEETNFNLIQKHMVGTAGGAITENSNAISGNNVLQRATACIESGSVCATTSSGNWLMQMAVFRDASWTVAGGWTPVRIAQILDASQFPGSDIGAKINSASVAGAAPGFRVHIPAGTYTVTTPIVPAASGYPYILEGDGGGTILNFTPTSGIAVTLAWSGPGGGIRNLQIACTGVSNTAEGLRFNVGAYGYTENIAIHGCGTGLHINNVLHYLHTFTGTHLYQNGIGLLDDQTSENDSFIGGSIYQNTTGASFTAISSDFTFHGTSFDDNVTGISITQAAIIECAPCHFENAHAPNVEPQYVTVSNGGQYRQYGGWFQDDKATGSQTQFVTFGGSHLILDGVAINTGGETITQVVTMTAGTAELTLPNLNAAVYIPSFNYSYTGGAVIDHPFKDSASYAPLAVQVNQNASVTVLNAQTSGPAVTGTGSAVTLYTYTLPMNTLLPNKGLRIKVYWQHSTGSASVAYSLTIGGTSVAGENWTFTSVDHLDATIMNVAGSQSSQSFVVDLFGNNAFAGTGFSNQNINFANPEVIAFTFNVASTDKVRPYLFTVELLQ